MMTGSMKKALPFLIFAAAISASSMFLTASSVQSRPPSLYLSGGISDPSGELANGVEIGYHGAGKVGFQLEPRTEFLFGAEYHAFRFNRRNLPDLSGRFQSIMVGFDLKINLGIPKEPLVPYLIFGGGYANTDFTDTLTQIPPKNSFKADGDSRSYFEFGGGFEVKRAFLLFRLVNIFTEQAAGRFFSIGIGYKLL